MALQIQYSRLYVGLYCESSVLQTLKSYLIRPHNIFVNVGYELEPSMQAMIMTRSGCCERSNLCRLTFLTTQEQAVASDGGGAGDGFTVMIVASGQIGGGGLVHAVTVTQPVQSWTVIRGQDDFRAVGDALSSVLPGIPSFPSSEVVDNGDLTAISKARNDLQQWLISILMYPGARESPAVRNFLTYNANMIPPQFEGVPWTSFAPDGTVLTTSLYSTQQQTQQHHQATAPAAAYGSSNLDDMEMDDMFAGDDDVGPLPNEDSDEDDDFIPASVRYKPTDEQITAEDEMDIMQLAGEVEMVEDVGSLAQSLGASHLGRSLKLQQEISKNQKQTQQPMQSGVRLGSAVSGGVGGGIGSAMARAVQGVGDSFNQIKPVSAPRLDSFKMIKVIGKGSFGK